LIIYRICRKNQILSHEQSIRSSYSRWRQRRFICCSTIVTKKSGLSIGIVEPSEKHYYQPAWTLVGAGEFDIAETEKNEKDYIPAGSTWIKDAVATFEPEQNQVTCKSGAKYTYKILIVAPGIQIDWQKIKGLSDTLGKNEVSSNYSFDIAPYTWELIKNFKGGVAVFTNPSTAIKCGELHTKSCIWHAIIGVKKAF
jgi:sulfide:quinone oxidoreductase